MEIDRIPAHGMCVFAGGMDDFCNHPSVFFVTVSPNHPMKFQPDHAVFPAYTLTEAMVAAWPLGSDCWSQAPEFHRENIGFYTENSRAGCILSAA